VRVAVDTNTLVSGLFFAGNERRLLLAAFEGRVRLVLSAHVVEETFEVIEETFRARPDLRDALRLLEIVFGQAELVPEASYALLVPRWAERVRDRKDAPVLACASAAKVDLLVSGDTDLLVLRRVDGIPIVRTDDALRRIA